MKINIHINIYIHIYESPQARIYSERSAIVPNTIRAPPAYALQKYTLRALVAASLVQQQHPHHRRQDTRCWLACGCSAPIAPIISSLQRGACLAHYISLRCASLTGVGWPSALRR